MTKKLIISVISEQSAPNLILMKNNIDADYFINIITNNMKRKAKYIENTINSIDNKEKQFIDIHIEPAIENKIQAVKEIIHKYKDNFDKAEQIYVNITGGTKILSIALYEYFNEHTEYKNKASILYLNADNTATSYYRLNKNDTIEMKENITIEEYLSSYGIKILNNDETEPKYSEKCANRILNNSITKKDTKIWKARKLLAGLMKVVNSANDIKEQEYNMTIELKKEIKKRLKDKSEEDCNIVYEYIKDLCDTIDELPKINEITYNTLKYLHSGFLEEAVYYKVITALNYTNNIKDFVKTGVKIYIDDSSRNTNQYLNNDQELDVLFMFNNNIYYIECKTYTNTNTKTNTDIINQAIFKQTSIANKMGLKTKNAFITLNETKYNTQDKMNLYKITLIDGTDIRQNKLTEKIKTKLCKIRI